MSEALLREKNILEELQSRVRIEIDRVVRALLSNQASRQKGTISRMRFDEQIRDFIEKVRRPRPFKKTSVPFFEDMSANKVAFHMDDKKAMVTTYFQELYNNQRSNSGQAHRDPAILHKL